ncbi:MAG: HEAT repeat domain-containing protein, partial [Myxococcota bacterium]
MLGRWLAIPDGEASKARRLVMMVFFLSAALALLKAAQSGIFLEAFPREMIPWAFAVSAVTLALASSLCVSLAPRVGPAPLAQGSLAVAIVLLLLLRGLLAVDPEPAVRFAVYVVIEAAAGVLVIQVWSVAASACDARSVRRLLPVAGLGAGFAWTLGGFLVPSLSRALGAESLLLIAPGLLVVAWVVVRRVVHLDLDERTRRGRKRQSLVQSWRDGIRFVIREPLMRMTASLAVLALLTEQFMDFTLMATAREELETAEAISAFYGQYYGVTSAIGLVLLAGASGRVLAALGASRSLLATPLAVGLAAVVALISPSLATAVVLRGVGRVLKQSVWSAAAEQLQTPLSSVRRSQARAAVRGVLAPAGYALSAVGLAFLPEHVDTRWLAVLVMGSAGTMVLIIVTRAQKTYRKALLQALDERRVMLGPGRAPASANLDVDACEALGEELRADDPARAELAAEVLGLSEAKAAAAELKTGLSHDAVGVRLAAVRGLARLSPEGWAMWLAERAAEEPSPDVRAAIAETLRAMGEWPEDVRQSVDSLVSDEDPRVSATLEIARLERRLQGQPLGEALLTSLEQREGLEAALSAIDSESVQAQGVLSRLSKWLEEGDPDARLLVARTVVRLHLTSLVPDVVRLLKDARTAQPAARLLVALGGLERGPKASERTLGASLTKLASRVARGPSEHVSEALVLRLLQHPDASIRRHAVNALGESIRNGGRMPLGEEVVEPLLARDVARAYQLYSILAGLAHDDGVPDWEVEDAFQPLAHEVDLYIEHTRRDVLALLLLRGRKRLVGAVEVGRRRRSAARDAQVAELLELGLERDLARRVVPLFERLSLRERVLAGRRVGMLDEHALADPLDAIVALGDPHLRHSARMVYGERFVDRYPELAKRHQPMVPIYERMRFLRSVPLFRDLSGDDVLRLAE